MPSRGLGYVATADQEGVAKGRRRYRFSIQFNNTRYRRVEVCAPSHVEKIFKCWVSSLLAERPDRMFFETLDAYLKWIAHSKGPAPVAAAGYLAPRLRACFKDMPMESIRKTHIDQYIHWRASQGSFKPATINRDIAALSSFLSWCIDREYYSRANPAFRSRLPERNEREVMLNREQLAELITKSQGIGEKFATAVAIGLLAGLRKGEILALTWSDVDLVQSVIRVRASTCKGGRSRMVAMPAVLRDWLVRIREQEPAPDMIFWDYHSKNRLRYQFEQLRDRLSFGTLKNGLTFTFHDLRRIYAQSLRYAGIELSDIRTLLGHSSVRITEQRYALFGRPDLQGVVDQIVTVIPVDNLRLVHQSGSHGQPMVNSEDPSGRLPH